MLRRKQQRHQQGMGDEAQPHHFHHRQRLHQPLGAGIECRKAQGGPGNEPDADPAAVCGVELEHGAKAF